MIKLSILIPSTFDRSEMTEILVEHLEIQSEFKPVEIITDIDNKEISIGAKRQRMLEKAKGEYVVMIDSDDWIPTDYVDEILKAIESNPDCVGHQIECIGTPGKTESVSNRYLKWAEKQRGFDYLRTPYPKVPIKREICLKIGYKDLRYGEDHDFSKRLKFSRLIKTETYISKVLYYYRYKFAPHLEKYGIKN
jgi:glycosyltransferase involved in cell wall biosynthesis